MFGIRTRGGHAGLLSSTGFLLWAVGPKSFCIVGPFFGLLLMYVGLDPVGPGSFNKSLDEKKKRTSNTKGILFGGPSRGFGSTSKCCDLNNRFAFVIVAHYGLFRFTKSYMC